LDLINCLTSHIVFPVSAMCHHVQLTWQKLLNTSNLNGKPQLHI